MKNSFNDLKGNLSEQDVDQILEIVGKRARETTKNRLRSILKYSSSLIPSYGIFERLNKEESGWIYTPGQSYPCEIRTIREIILKGK